MTNGDPFTHIIRHCNACRSQQNFIYGTDTLLSFSLHTNSEQHEYYISYDIRTRRLYIAQIGRSSTGGLQWTPRVETVLSEYPNWLQPNHITEMRVSTLVVFS